MSVTTRRVAVPSHATYGLPCVQAGARILTLHAQNLQRTARLQGAYERFKAAVPMRIRGRLLKRVVDPDGVEEAIVGRLVRRGGGGTAAAAAEPEAEAEEAQRRGRGLGRGAQVDFDELEHQFAGGCRLAFPSGK